MPTMASIGVHVGAFEHAGLHPCCVFRIERIAGERSEQSIAATFERVFWQ